MTQTEVQRNTFAAATSIVTPGDSQGNQVIIDLLDDMPSRLATAVMLRGGAEELMRSLAETLGFRVIAEDTAVELTKYVGSLIASVDAKREEAFKEGSLGAAQGALFAGTDALRDLRDRLVREDVTNR